MVISISKIKKIRLIRKNWILNGRWFEDRGSNPHSNGEDFSWSFKDFFERSMFRSIRKREIAIKMIIKNIIRLIIYIKLN